MNDTILKEASGWTGPNISIMIVGVGGQGTLLASRIIGHVIQKVGLDVKVSEVHGMSQRGGSVVTYVKFGSKVYSPIIEKGEADVILAFEELEAYRWLDYLKKDGKIIVNLQKIDPMPVILGAAKYPEGIPEKIKRRAAVSIQLDALEIARKCGNAKAVNVVLLGVLAAKLPFARSIWEESIREVVPAKFVELNLKAFDEGYSLAEREEAVHD